MRDQILLESTLIKKKTTPFSQRFSKTAFFSDPFFLNPRHPIMSDAVPSPPIVPSSNTASGRGSGQGRGQSGSRGRGNRHGSRAITTPRVRSTFKGNTEEMNGHVF